MSGGQFTSKQSVRGTIYFEAECPGDNLLCSRVSGRQLTSKQSVRGTIYFEVECPADNLQRSRGFGTQRFWYTEGLVHRGLIWYTEGLVHRGFGTQRVWYIYNEAECPADNLQRSRGFGTQSTSK